MSDDLLDLLSSLDKSQVLKIKKVLGLDVSQAIRILKSGRKLNKISRAKYGYFFSKFRTKEIEKLSQTSESFSNLDDNFYTDYLFRNKLEEF
tara:strand:- start:671 stop:946 length:276 start_codon:yes stop_codon:yes gene_type:complete